MKLGSQIVGHGSTHQILQRKGLAGPLVVFPFVTSAAVPVLAKGNATAVKLKQSIGEFVKKNHGAGTGVSIYGVSPLNGYHSILLTYRIKNGIHDFSLIDQGPATSFLTGKSTFKTAQALDLSS